MLSKYKLTKELSAGSFGKVYQGVHKRNGTEVAIKVEKRKEHSSLKHEARVYHYLKCVKGIPNIIWYGTDNVNNYIILPLMGENVKQAYDAQRFQQEHLGGLAKSMCEILKQVHLLEIVHGDIKPENFIFDREYRQVYLIDFGFARKFSAKPKRLQSPSGTPCYMSRRCHSSLEPGYIDDVESLLYLVLSLYYTKLPWQDNMVGHTDIAREKEILIGIPERTPDILRGLLQMVESGDRGCLPEYNRCI